MINLAQRIETLRTSKGMTRPELSAALGFPKTAIEKFETGRQTPTKAQQRKLAEYFGVSVDNLQGNSDEGGMSLWMSDDTPVDTPIYTDAPKRAPKPAASAEGNSGNMFDGFLSSKKFQDALHAAAMDALRSPEGQEILSNIVRREISKIK